MTDPSAPSNVPWFSVVGAYYIEIVSIGSRHVLNSQRLDGTEKASLELNNTFSPSLTPVLSGNTVYYARRINGVSCIVGFSASTHVEKVITCGPNTFVPTSIVVSPENGYIVFIATWDDESAKNIYFVPITGGDWKRLTTETVRPDDVRVAGIRILFRSKNSNSLFVANFVENSAASLVKFHPENSRFYVNYPYAVLQSADDTVLLNIDTKALTRLAEDDQESFLVNVAFLAESILLEYQTRSEKRNLYYMQFTDTEMTAVKSDVSSYAISPNNEFIILQGFDLNKWNFARQKILKTAEGIVTSYLISPDSSYVVMSQPYEPQGRYVSPGQPLILLRDLQQETPLRRYLTPRDFSAVEILFFYSSGTRLLFTGNVDPTSTVLRLYSSSTACN